MSYMHDLLNGLALLCHQRPSRFENEAALRRFQFKIWLRTDKWSADVFQQAGRLFTATRLTNSMRINTYELLKNGGYKERPHSQFIEAIRSEPDLFDATFGNRELLSIPSVADYDAIVDNAATDLREIRDINAQTLWRLRSTASRMTPSLSNARLLYDEFTNGVEGSMGLTRLKEIHLLRFIQQPFTFVAEKTWPELLKIDPDLHQEVCWRPKENDKSRWIKFCSGVIHVMEELQMKEEADRLAKATELLPEAWDEFEPISQEDLDIAGISPVVRRSALETKKAMRSGRNSPT